MERDHGIRQLVPGTVRQPGGHTQASFLQAKENGLPFTGARERGKQGSNPRIPTNYSIIETQW